MSFEVTVHYDNSSGFTDPHLWVWYDGSGSPDDFAPTGHDTFGPVFDVETKRERFWFKFKEGQGGAGPWEAGSLDRSFRPLKGAPGAAPVLNEVWCRGGKAFVYPVPPREPEAVSAESFLATVSPKQGIFLPDVGGASGLGATPLAGGGVLFGLYHPNAARVYVFGSFNGWQRPGHDTPNPSRFREMSPARAVDERAHRVADHLVRRIRTRQLLEHRPLGILTAAEIFCGQSARLRRPSRTRAGR